MTKQPDGGRASHPPSRRTGILPVLGGRPVATVDSPKQGKARRELAMRRFLLILCSILGLVLIPAALGCHEQKIKTFEERESVHESEPEMVSPGEPIVE